MNESNYYVILFKNNKKKKVIKSFITKNKALEFYKKEIKKSNECEYKKEFENGIPCTFKIGLASSIEKPSEQIYYTDELGRTRIIDGKISDNLYLIDISEYSLPEKFYDYQKKSKISISDFLKNYIKKDVFYMISKLNNKMILQNDENINLFSFKTNEECERFLNTLLNLNITRNFMIILDSSSAQKKYLYEILENYGFSKQYLYRSSTTHPK